MKNNNRDLIKVVGGIIGAVVALIGIGAFALAISGTSGCPYLPLTNITQHFGNSTGYSGSGAAVYVNTVTGYCYLSNNYNWAQVGYWDGNGSYFSWGSPEVEAYYLTNNASWLSNVNGENNAEISYLQGQLNTYGGCVNHVGNACNRYQNITISINDMIYVLNQVNGYNTKEAALLEAQSSPTTTVCSNCIQTTSPTTTIESTSEAPNKAPAAQIQVALDNFFANLYASWTHDVALFTAYFDLPSDFFSIANVSSSNGKNITTINSRISPSISLTIPQSEESTAWVIGSTKVTETFCQSAITETLTSSGSSSTIYNSSVVNMSGTTQFSSTYSFVANRAGIIQVGGLCQSTNTTLVNGAWTSWSPYQNVSSEHYAIYVVNGSISGPSAAPQANPLQGIEQFFSNLGASLWKFLTSL